MRPQKVICICILYVNDVSKYEDRRGRGSDRTVIGFITAYAINAYHHYICDFKFRPSEVYSIQHYVIKFVSDLLQVGGFLRLLRFLPLIKLTATI